MPFQEFVDQDDPNVKLSKQLRAAEWHQKVHAMLFKQLIADTLAEKLFWAELEEPSPVINAIAAMDAPPKRLCD